MPTLASISVKYGRKFPIRRDDWVNLEALVTLTVSVEEADLTDPHEVAAEAFRIARQAVREQGRELRRQIEEAEARAAEEAEQRQLAAQVEAEQRATAARRAAAPRTGR
jgi:hypothetical protein